MRNEQRFLFESLHSGDTSTFQLLTQSLQVNQMILHTQSPYFKAWKIQYMQAFRLYREGHWVEAAAEFDKCLQLNPKDNPSIVLQDFIQQKLQNSSSNRVWKGYRELNEK